MQTYLNVSGVSQPVPCALKVWNKKDAMRKALTFGGAVCVISILTIMIPMVHFLTVPAGVLGSPLIGFLVFRLYEGSVDIVAANFKCPKCHEIIDLKDRSLTKPMHITCEKCHHLTSATMDER